MWYSLPCRNTRARRQILPRTIKAATTDGRLSGAGGPAERCNSSRCCVLDLLTNLFIALGFLVLAQSSAPSGGQDPRAEAAPARDGSSVSKSTGVSSSLAAQERQRISERRSPWFHHFEQPARSGRAVAEDRAPGSGADEG